jgi:hypothetical protein
VLGQKRKEGAKIRERTKEKKGKLEGIPGS